MVFVTGGTGLVGAKLIFDLVSQGETVTALKRPDTPLSKFASFLAFYTHNIKSIEDKVTWVEGDLLNIENLIQTLEAGAKVYHCAAMVSFNPKKSREIIETNVEGTANLVNACLIKKIDKLCHVSSIGALGSMVNGQSINEETPWTSVGKSAYSLSKHYSELEIWRGIAEGLNAVIVNPAVILGPGDWSTGSPQLFSMVAKGLKYYTLGSTSYIDVKDVTKAMIALMDSNIQSERFLLASETLSYKELFSSIAKSIQVKAPYKHATKVMTGLAYRFEKLRSGLLHKEPKMTKQTHKIAHKSDIYLGSKITERLKFSYTPIRETLSFIGNCYLQSQSSHQK
jgi:nucleoside-diphosphate-sugar epimerase